MILYVDMEHELGRAAPWGEAIMAGRLKVKYRLEAMTGLPCLIAHYTRVDQEFMHRYPFSAALLSGSGTDPEHYTDLDPLLDMVRQAPVPILGLCGGWQFMAQAFGGEIRPLGPLPEGAPPLEDEVIFRPGMKQEYGFHPIRISGDHPLLDGLEYKPYFWQAHYMEVNPVPAGFLVYAESDLCRVQFAAHERLPLFGTQFHPEHYDEAHLAGRKVLENFFRLAGIAPVKRIESGRS